MAIRIYIDQGHNPYGVNAGAEGFGLREQDITYLVGAYLYDLLSANTNFEALTSRKTPDDSLGYNNYSSLKQRVDEAKEWGAGTEGYVYSDDSESYSLATVLLDSIVNRLGTTFNGIYARPSLYVLRRTPMPAVLVELAYITNYEDAMLLGTRQYDFAYALYQGFLLYFGLDE